MKRNIIILILFMVLAISQSYAGIPAGASLPELMAEKPLPPHPSWQIIIGDYAGSGVEFKIREDKGRLELLYRDQVFPLEKRTEDTYEIQFPNPLKERSLVFSSIQDDLAYNCSIGETLCSRTICLPMIKPKKSPGTLREQALRTQPPVEKGNFVTPDLVEVNKLNPAIKLDIRYATANNFMGTPLYEQARAFLQRPAAEALVRVHNKLKQYGYGLLVYDAYRPWYITKMMWDATPDFKKNFVANPAGGSVHNRGAAVDLTLYELATGKPVDTGGEFDEFGDRSSTDYMGGTALQRWYREVLNCAMASEGFKVYPYEWWHFNYKGYAKNPIMNVTFDKIEHR